MLSRRHFLATAASLTASLAGGFATRVDAQGRKVLVATIPSNPSTLDPLNQSNHDAMAVSQLIYQNLLEVDVDGNLVPQLAVDLPEISEDRLTYTFRLREGVRFHNGAPFTAADVKYSYDYMLDPANEALRRSYWTAIERVEVARHASPRNRRFSSSAFEISSSSLRLSTSSSIMSPVLTSASGPPAAASGETCRTTAP